MSCPHSRALTPQTCSICRRMKPAEPKPLRGEAFREVEPEELPPGPAAEVLKALPRSPPPVLRPALAAAAARVQAREEERRRAREDACGKTASDLPVAYPMVPVVEAPGRRQPEPPMEEPAQKGADSMFPPAPKSSHESPPCEVEASVRIGGEVNLLELAPLPPEEIAFVCADLAQIATLWGRVGRALERAKEARKEEQ